MYSSMFASQVAEVWTELPHGKRLFPNAQGRPAMVEKVNSSSTLSAD